MSQKTLLVVGAHHDDCEYAAGGLILKAVKKGWRVVMVTLAGDHSSWKSTMGRAQVVRDGLLKLAKEMGVEKRFYGWGYHDIYYDLKGVNVLAELALELKPRMALFHWQYDYWPDHEAAGKLSKHAFWFPPPEFVKKGAENVPQLLAFEAGPNQSDPAVQFRPDVYIDISDEINEVGRVIHRLDELAEDKSVSGETCHELDKRAKARIRGSECACSYAEAFVSLKKTSRDIL